MVPLCTWSTAAGCCGNAAPLLGGADRSGALLISNLTAGSLRIKAKADPSVRDGVQWLSESLAGLLMIGWVESWPGISWWGPFGRSRWPRSRFEPVLSQGLCTRPPSMWPANEKVGLFPWGQRCFSPASSAPYWDMLPGWGWVWKLIIAVQMSCVNLCQHGDDQYVLLPLVSTKSKRPLWLNLTLSGIPPHSLPSTKMQPHAIHLSEDIGPNTVESSAAELWFWNMICQ